MSDSGVQFRERTASEQQIYSHLMSCDDEFKPRLSLRVNLAEFSKKIYEEARTFEAFQRNRLVGLVAMYLDEAVPPIAFVTNVSVMREFSRARIATSLLSSCLSYARRRAVRSVVLEVQRDNRVAIELYQKFDFEATEMRGAFLVMKLDLLGGRRGHEALRA